MSVLFSSDFHLGHKVIVPKYRDFSSQEEHDNLILDQMAVLNKRDILFVLGDFIFDSDKYDWYMQQINRMACRIKLVMGNHDSLKLYKEPKLEIQLPLFSYKNFWLSHAPIHPQEIRNRYANIHGHTHNHLISTRKLVSRYGGLETVWQTVPDPKYVHIGLDTNNFKFVNFDEIKETYVQ